eukprot:Amastigsp_a849161_28.p3 type:complete len:135 gc:universal Amastigsp_a849161_28:734-330(-)
MSSVSPRPRSRLGTSSWLRCCRHRSSAWVCAPAPRHSICCAPRSEFTRTFSSSWMRLVGVALRCRLWCGSLCRCGRTSSSAALSIVASSRRSRSTITFAFIRILWPRQSRSRRAFGAISQPRSLRSLRPCPTLT